MMENNFKFFAEAPTVAESSKKLYVKKISELANVTISRGYASISKEMYEFKYLFSSSITQNTTRVPEDTWAHNKMFKLKRIAARNNFQLPNETVVKLSKEALNCIKNNDGTLVFCNPTTEGGTLIEFKKNDVSFILEIDNNIEIALLKKSEIPLIEDLTRDTFLNTLQFSLENA